MSISAIRADERVQNVYFSEDTISVDIMDGRTITVPLVWYPKLLAATPKQSLFYFCCTTRRFSQTDSIASPPVEFKIKLLNLFKCNELQSIITKSSRRM